MSVLGVLLLIYVGIIVVLYLAQRQILYYPIGINNAPEGVSQLTAIDTQNRGYSPEGWFIPPTGEYKSVILHFHGNAGNVASRYTAFLPLLATGYGALFAEYSGYNGNHGKPSKDNIIADADGYIQKLFELGYEAKDIVVYGESLGSGPASYVATKYDVPTLILQVPYDSIAAVAKKKYPFIIGLDYLLKDNFDNVEYLTNYKGRSLFLLAERDNVIPTIHGETLYNSVSEPKLLHVFKGAGHNDIYETDYLQRVYDFLVDQ